MSKRVAHNKLTKDEIEKRIIDKFGKDLSIVEIVDSNCVKVKSNICGHEYSKKLYDLIKGKPVCRECSMKDRSKLHLSKSNFCLKYKDIMMNYEIIGNWKTSQDVTTIKCKKCNKSWNTRPYNVAIGKSGCPYCGEYSKTSIDTLYISERLKDTDFELLSECCCGKDNILVLHKKCGNKFNVKASAFINKLSCPNCKVKSKGEEVIFNTLKKYNIKFKKECAFKDLRGLGGGYLRYDFGIYSDGKLKYFIEYDGIQHSKPLDYKFFKNTFDKIKAHDEIKDKYCEDNNYILFRITHKNRRTIEKLVVEFLKEHMLIPSQAS